MSQRGMQDWGRILWWNKWSMWEGVVEGRKSPLLEENRLRERGVRWRGKRSWNNARLGSKRERGFIRSKRWAIRRGVEGIVSCFWGGGLCLDVWNHLSEWIPSITSNPWFCCLFRTVWQTTNVWQSFRTRYQGLGCLFLHEIGAISFKQQLTQIWSCHQLLRFVVWNAYCFLFFSGTQKKIFCWLSRQLFSIQQNLTGCSEKVWNYKNTVKVAYKSVYLMSIKSMEENYCMCFK